MRRLILLLAVPLLVGCATGRYTERVLESWLRAPIAEAISEWGPPTRVVEAGGRTFYTWDDGGLVQLPSTTTTYGTVYPNPYLSTFSAQSYTTGGGMVQVWCSKTLITDASGMIVSWRWEGNDCH